MRSIINISLPSSLATIVGKNVVDGHYASTSEFFRNLLRLWLDGKLAEELEESRVELRRGRGKVLRSLKDLR